MLTQIFLSGYKNGTQFMDTFNKPRIRKASSSRWCVLCILMEGKPFYIQKLGNLDITCEGFAVLISHTNAVWIKNHLMGQNFLHFLIGGTINNE